MNTCILLLLLFPTISNGRQMKFFHLRYAILVICCWFVVVVVVPEPLQHLSLGSRPTNFDSLEVAKLHCNLLGHWLLVAEAAAVITHHTQHQMICQVRAAQRADHHQQQLWDTLRTESKRKFIDHPRRMEANLPCKRGIIMCVCVTHMCYVRPVGLIYCMCALRICWPPAALAYINEKDKLHRVTRATWV